MAGIREKVLADARAMHDEARLNLLKQLTINRQLYYSEAAEGVYYACATARDNNLYLISTDVDPSKGDPLAEEILIAVLTPGANKEKQEAIAAFTARIKGKVLYHGHSR